MIYTYGHSNLSLPTFGKHVQNKVWSITRHSQGNDAQETNRMFVSGVHQFRAQFEIVIIEGIARTQSPTNKNDAVELPTFGVITGVNLT